MNNCVGFDFGTAFLVVARKDEDGKVVIKGQRNCFLDVGVEFEDMVSSSDYDYIKDIENGEEKIFVVGKDALALSNLYSKNDIKGDRKTSLRRPMKKMVINSKSDKRSIKMLKYMSQSLIGKPKKKGDIAVISIPANPVSGEFNNLFHQNMCLSFIRELGWEVFPIQEYLAVIYASNPSADGEDGEKLNMTGIGVSFGSGGCNLGLSYRGQGSISLSIPIGGDWIDESVSSVTQKTSSEITVLKEKYSQSGVFDLSRPPYDYEGEDQDVIMSLYIYYKNLIDTVVKQFKEEFIKNGTMFQFPIEVILSGGTSKPNGFEALVEQVIKEVQWPFDIKGVRRAKDPLSATAIGCLTAAISREKKNKLD
jgi:hypothetical protein